ncbi:MAG: NFACT family protein [Clostridiales bacterium]|nr:NFACT family protein [Clostridiales bacterium]
MPLDGVSSRCLAAELNELLAGARVDRIYQPDRADILFVLRGDSRNHRLLVSANPSAPRLHVSDEDRENPGTPPMFCMLLRKHLLGARLTAVETPGYERIFVFHFTVVDELGDTVGKRLVAEIMGRHSNIILLNEDGRIHDAIVHVDESVSRVREIMPARVYQLPPDQQKTAPPDLLTLSGLELPWRSPALANKTVDKALLASIQGFSPQLCQDVVLRAGLDERLRAGQLDEAGHELLAAVLKRLVADIEAGRFAPSTFHTAPDEPIPLDFHALPLQIYAIRRPAASLSQAMDLFYLERERQNRLRQKKQVLEKRVVRQLEHARRKLQIHEEDIRDGQSSDDWRIQGELILANIANWREGDATLEAVDYYDPEQKTRPIAIDPGLTAAQMAQRCFRRYNRTRTRGETGLRLAREDRREIDYLESVQVELAQASDLSDLVEIRRELAQNGLDGADPKANQSPADAARDRQFPGKAGSRAKRHQQQLARGRQKNKKKGAAPADAPLSPRRYRSSDGLTILVGRNNLQNDYLTLRLAAKDDLWLHVQKLPGSHVIVRAERREIPEKTLLEAAGLAAWFSRATLSLRDGDSRIALENGSQKVAVDYCPVSHVRKPSGAKPGMVIYEHYQTVYVSPALLPED